ncbi:Protein of unknown function [bacterium A37T11]|nr:Protein of unknown function [bacterium A37T11]
MNQKFKKQRTGLVNNDMRTRSDTLFKITISRYNKALYDDLVTFDRDSLRTRIYYTNTSIVNLFKASIYHTANIDYYNKFLKVECADSPKLFYPSRDTNYYANMERYAYNFEMILPPETNEDKAFSLMNTQLKLYFNHQTEFKEETINCLVLTVLDNIAKLKTKGGARNFENTPEHDGFALRNESVKTLVNVLQNPDWPPIIDETGLDNNIDIFLLYKNYNLKAVNEQLLSYGLQLKQTERKVKLLVIN